MKDKSDKTKKRITATERRKATIERRQARQKELLLEEIGKTPFVYVAAKKVGIGRTTVYRLIREDSSFARSFNEKRSVGEALLGEIAEFQLFKAIQNGDLRAIMFYLSHRNSKYKKTFVVEDPTQPALTAEKLREIQEKMMRWKSLPPKKQERVRVEEP